MIKRTFLIELPEREKTEVGKLVGLKTKTTTIKSNTILDKMNKIKSDVEKHLGKYRNITYTITDIKELKRYIDKCIENGIVGIDTETTGLDPILDEIVGVCLYTYGEKAAYIPINHRSYITNELIGGQLTKEVVKEQLDRLIGVRTVYHNAKFDIRFLKNQLSVNDTPYWDTFLAAKLIDEEESASLKNLYSKHIENKKSDYDFGKLFRAVDFRHVPIDLATLYAAVDAFITIKLMEYQSKVLNNEDGPYNVLMNIEMPLVKVVADMEDRGIGIDKELSRELAAEYNIKKQGLEKEIHAMIAEYEDDIKAYNEKIMFNQKTPNKDKETIPYPINIASSKQLAAFLYDVLKIDVVDREKPRGTGEPILKQIDHPICRKILDYRGVVKLLNTYIEKLPKAVNEKTQKVHASFNQYGAETGRFSSSDPNLQNIPTRDENGKSYSKIRNMFIPKKGYKLVGADYSQQEPRLLTQISGDESMWDAYTTGKDLYSWSASLIYKIPYEYCHEIYLKGAKVIVDGKEIVVQDEEIKNPEGKTRRKKMKAIILGIMYGKGVGSIAKDLGITWEEAQKLYDTFFENFPKVEAYMRATQQQAREKGYVETLWGRRRHLPDMQLPQFEAKLVSKKWVKLDCFNPFFDSDLDVVQVENSKTQNYIKRLKNCVYYKEKEQIKKEAQADGIQIIDNSGFIAQATRQCVNSTIQGSASDLTKIAMIKVHNDSRLKDLDFHLLLTVHDELIGECPAENADKVKEILVEIMVNAGGEYVKVPMKADGVILDRWEA